MRTTIRLAGVDKSLRFCDAISQNISRVIEKETEVGAREIRKREQALAPVKTGKLRKSIVTRKGKYGISKMVRAKAPHAPLQEYGTKRGVKAKRFAEKAREELLPGIEARIRAAVKREVTS